MAAATAVKHKVHPLERKWNTWLGSLEVWELRYLTRQFGDMSMELYLHDEYFANGLSLEAARSIISKGLGIPKR